MSGPDSGPICGGGAQFSGCLTRGEVVRPLFAVVGKFRRGSSALRLVKNCRLFAIGTGFRMCHLWAV